MLLMNEKVNQILIVDDKPQNVEIIANILNAENYKLAYALNGKDALNIIEHNTFDLILLDIMLPDIDGYDICQNIRSNPLTKDIPIIFITAKAEIESVVKGFELGGQDYIVKPFHPKELISRVKTQLELKNQRELLYNININLENRIIEITKQIRKSEEKYKFLFENANDGILLLQNLIIKYANKKIDDMFNINHLDLSGKNIVELLSIENLDELKKQLLDPIDNVNSQSMQEYQVSTQNNQNKWVEINSVNVDWDNEVSTLCIIRDITYRVNITNKLKRISNINSFLSRCNEAIVRIQDKNVLFSEICKLAVMMCEYNYSCIINLNNKKSDTKIITFYSDKTLENTQHINDSFENDSNLFETLKSGKHYLDNLIVRGDDNLVFSEKNRIFFLCLPLYSAKNISHGIIFCSTNDIFNENDEFELLTRLTENISIALSYLLYTTSNAFSTTNNLNHILPSEKDIIQSEIENKQASWINPKSEPPKIVNKMYNFEDIVTQDKYFINQLSYLPEIAKSDVTVLIYGESGTGKELVSSAIKNLSQRKDKPFLIVNCAALHDTLLESELFGYMKGAFTGANNNKIGLLQSANDGTLFLDEIGDVTPNMQAKLLRVLQQKEIIPVGATTNIKIETRFICATNKNLEELVFKGDFRADLYYRLNIIRINIPPLRERKCDIPLLIDHFIQLYKKETNKNISGITNEALEVLVNYNYPGNVRELENIIRHAFVYCQYGVIETKHFENKLSLDNTINIINKNDTNLIKTANSNIEYDKSNIVEKDMIFNALQKNRWNINKTAIDIGMHRTTLYRKIKKYSL